MYYYLIIPFYLFLANNTCLKIYLSLWFHAHHVSSLHHYLVHWFVQHVGSSINST